MTNKQMVAVHNLKNAAKALLEIANRVNPGNQKDIFDRIISGCKQNIADVDTYCPKPNVIVKNANLEKLKKLQEYLQMADKHLLEAPTEHPNEVKAIHAEYMKLVDELIESESQ